MSQHDCPFCTLDTGQGDGVLLTYSAHAKLADHIGEILYSEGIPYRQDECLIVIPAETSARRQKIIQDLHQGLSTIERKLVKIGRGRLSHIFGAPDIDTYSEIVKTEWFDRALAEDQFTIYYQPIVDITTGHPFAHECLIRLELDRLYTGSEIVAAASLRGEILAFDNYARGKAIRSAASQPRAETKLFINFFPSAMYDPGPSLETTLAQIEQSGLAPSDVVFEIIECDQITNLGHTRQICEFFRQHGFLYAIDDLGSGTNGLETILALRPDFIKIDKSVVWNLADPSRRETLRHAIELAGQINSEVIAEGIETPDQAKAVRQFGIRLMQGYGLGKPSAQMNTGLAQSQEDLIQLSSAVTTTSSAAPGSGEMKADDPASSSHTPRTRP